MIESGLEEVMTEYFKALYSSKGCSSDECLTAIMPSITEADNVLLIAHFSASEIKEAVFSMHPDKSPKPDGMNPAFYPKYWHIVGSDICSTCLSYLSNTELP